MCGADTKTIENWLNGRCAPKAAKFDAVLVVFRKARIEDALISLLDAAYRARGVATDAAPAVWPRPAGKARPVTDRKIAAPELVDLSLDKPGQGSSPEEFELLLTLLFRTHRVTDRRFRAEIGLRQARLVYEAIACHPRVNSRYGQLPTRPDVVELLEGDQWRFVGPLDAEGVLRGGPPELDQLAVMQRDGTDVLPRVTVSLQCDRDSDLEVVIRQADVTMSASKQKVVERYLKKCLRAPDGSVRLGEASLIWKDDT